MQLWLAATTSVLDTGTKQSAERIEMKIQLSVSSLLLLHLVASTQAILATAFTEGAVHRANNNGLSAGAVDGELGASPVAYRGGK